MGRQWLRVGLGTTHQLDVRSVAALTALWPSAVRRHRHRCWRPWRGSAGAHQALLLIRAGLGPPHQLKTRVVATLAALAQPLASPASLAPVAGPHGAHQALLLARQAWALPTSSKRVWWPRWPPWPSPSHHRHRCRPWWGRAVPTRLSWPGVGTAHQLDVHAVAAQAQLRAPAASLAPVAGPHGAHYAVLLAAMSEAHVGGGKSPYRRQSTSKPTLEVWMLTSPETSPHNLGAPLRGWCLKTPFS